MPQALVPVILLVLAPLAKAQAEPQKSVGIQTPQPLELRLTEPLRWENGCLRVRLELVNRSEKTFFLPAMGLYIDSSTKLLSSVAEKNGSEEWQNVYGFTDILSLPNAKPLAPGASVHRNYRFAPTLAVVKLQTETRRELPLRGRLKISASYYLSDPTNRTKSRLSSSSQRTWAPVFPPQPQVSTLIAPIPCPDGGCPQGCEDPPLILEGEGVAVPDVFLYQPEWNERGKAVAEELNRLFPCSK
jgi:hypothetical protein